MKHIFKWNVLFRINYLESTLNNHFDNTIFAKFYYSRLDTKAMGSNKN